MAALLAPPLTPWRSPSGYIAARNAYDVQQARELVADDFRTKEYPNGYRDADTGRPAFAQHQAFGVHYSQIGCNPGKRVARPGDGVL